MVGCAPGLGEPLGWVCPWTESACGFGDLPWAEGAYGLPFTVVLRSMRISRISKLVRTDHRQTCSFAGFDCPRVQCGLRCAFGRKLDANGCEMCACAPHPLTGLTCDVRVSSYARCFLRETRCNEMARHPKSRGTG